MHMCKFWQNNASFTQGEIRFEISTPGIAFADLPPIDLVLVSHNHYDHLDLATLKQLKASHDPLVITPLGNDVLIGGAVPGMRLSAHDWGDRVEIGNGVFVHVEPAHHWSARGARDRRMALWAGFVIETPGGKIYFAGDTGFHDGINYRLMARQAWRLPLRHPADRRL